MLKISELTITSIERNCIACPASWFGRTKDGGCWYARFRSGVFSLRHSAASVENKYIPIEDEIYRDDSYGSLDGYMHAYQLRDKLVEEGVRFEEGVLPENFYGHLNPSECRFSVLGDRFCKARCPECEYEITEEDVEKIQYETVIPEQCLVCSSDLDVITEIPKTLNNSSD